VPDRLEPQSEQTTSGAIVIASDAYTIVRYAIHRSQSLQPCYTYSLRSGLSKPFPFVGYNRIDGWLIDCEKIVSGPREIIVVKRDSRCFYVIDDVLFDTLSPKVEIRHTKGSVISELTVVDKTRDTNKKMRYLTPWWRLALGDGMFPDMMFPLEYFADVRNLRSLRVGVNAKG
jgi:hypothetical protein